MTVILTLPSSTMHKSSWVCTCHNNLKIRLRNDQVAMATPRTDVFMRPSMDEINWYSISHHHVQVPVAVAKILIYFFSHNIIWPVRNVPFDIRNFWFNKSKYSYLKTKTIHCYKIVTTRYHFVALVYKFVANPYSYFLSQSSFSVTKWYDGSLNLVWNNDAYPHALHCVSNRESFGMQPIPHSP